MGHCDNQLFVYFPSRYVDSSYWAKSEGSLESDHITIYRVLVRHTSSATRYKAIDSIQSWLGNWTELAKRVIYMGDCMPWEIWFHIKWNKKVNISYIIGRSWNNGCVSSYVLSILRWVEKFLISWVDHEAMDVCLPTFFQFFGEMSRIQVIYAMHWYLFLESVSTTS